MTYNAHYYKQKLKTYNDCGLKMVPNSFLLFEQMIKEMERLEENEASLLESNIHFKKIADWLALKLSLNSQCINPKFDCKENGQMNQCYLCWLEIARKAVGGDK